MTKYDIARETQAGTTLQFDTDKLQLCVLCEDNYTVDVPDATLDIMSRFDEWLLSTSQMKYLDEYLHLVHYVRQLKGFMATGILNKKTPMSNHFKSPEVRRQCDIWLRQLQEKTEQLLK
jgi:hypothetical protein